MLPAVTRKVCEKVIVSNDPIEYDDGDTTESVGCTKQSDEDASSIWMVRFEPTKNQTRREIYDRL
jgi:hypothetical protein